MSLLSRLASNTAIALELRELLRDMILSICCRYGVSAIGPRERWIDTEAELIAALLETGELTLRLGADITLTADLVIPADKHIDFGVYRFVQGGAVTVMFYGEAMAGRVQIFSGFGAGQIRGQFGTAIFPEWWGLVADNHDLAINAALKAYVLSGIVSPRYGVPVSLAPFEYRVSSDIDMSSTMSSLIGAGSGMTTIQSTTAWAPAVWRNCEAWPDHVSGNHACMIAMGGPSGYSTYRTKVTGIMLNVGNASYAHWTKHVSGISSYGGLEEQSVIDDVIITSASGFGIGFSRHKPVGGAYGNPATVNGLSVSNFWITGPTKRDAYGMFFTHHTYDAKVHTGTIDNTLAQSISAAHSGAVPEQICTYGLFGIVAQGSLDINGVHIEAYVIPINIRENTGGGNNVTVSNIDAWLLMDPIRGSVYSLTDAGAPPILPAGPAGLDEVAGYAGRDFSHEAGALAAKVITTLPADEDRFLGYSCVVLISKAPGSYAFALNVKDRVVLSNIKAQGGCTYLLRDGTYGIHVRPYGMGERPQDGTGTIGFYCRGNSHVGALTLPYPPTPRNHYDRSNPGSSDSMSRQFFIGPIF